MTATATNKVTCYDCHRTAVVEVLVPWVNAYTGEVGATWTPLCWRHYPTGEQWETILRPGQRTTFNAVRLHQILRDRAE